MNDWFCRSVACSLHEARPPTTLEVQQHNFSGTQFLFSVRVSSFHGVPERQIP